MEINFPGFDLFWSLVLATVLALAVVVFANRRIDLAEKKNDHHAGSGALLIIGIIVSVFLFTSSNITGCQKYGNYYRVSDELTISYQPTDGVPTVRIDSPHGFNQSDIAALKLILEAEGIAIPAGSHALDK